MSRPLCFVLMPFRKKRAPSGALVDFVAVYRDLIAPAITEADLESLGADEEVTGGSIRKPRCDDELKPLHGGFHAC